MGTNFFELLSSHFDIYLYTTRYSGHEQVEKIRRQCNVWREVYNLSKITFNSTPAIPFCTFDPPDDVQTAKLIFDDNIDMLVDMTGWIDEPRVEVLALRPAPILASYLGYPGTLGMFVFVMFRWRCCGLLRVRSNCVQQRGGATLCREIHIHAKHLPTH